MPQSLLIDELFISSAGKNIALKTYGNRQGKPVIALHGWQDNAATFDLLAPQLDGLYLICVDLPGHGLSEHRQQGAEYYIWSYIEDILSVAQAMELSSFSLLGHSMGGAIACLFAALYPQRLHKLALLDAVGPLSASGALPQMQKALRQKTEQKQRARNYYNDYASAVAARAKKGICTAAATILASRGVSEDEQGAYWHHDSRLSKTNLMSMTEEQVRDFMQNILCPTLLIAGTEFWGSRKEWFEQRCGYIEGLQRHILDGKHHQHLEENAGEVAGLLNGFFSD